MRMIATLVAISVITTHAVAVERHNMSNMSCDEIGSALKREQRSILERSSQHVPNLMLYDLFERDRQSCSPDQTAVQAQVTAADGPCGVYRCATVTKTFKRL